MATPDPVPAAPNSPASGEPAAKVPEAPPAWFLDHQAKVEGRLSEIGKDFGRIREKLKLTEPNDAPKAPAAGDPRADALAAMKLGETRARLNEKARSRLDEKLANGMSFADAISWADDILSLATQVPEGAKPPATPTGQSATGAPSSQPTITNRRELMALAKADRKAYNAWMDQNDYQSLPR